MSNYVWPEIRQAPEDIRGATQLVFRCLFPLISHADIESAQDEHQPTDEEGPDYWKIMVMKLKEKGKIDEDIEQKSNIDWVLTHDDLADYFMKLTIDPAYVPRRGELVLWVWSGLEDGSLMHNPETGVIEVFGNDNKWHGTPNWRAGIVTQTPHDEVHMVDIIDRPDSPRGLSYSGFRVETLPDPLGTDKSYSRQYSYVPLRNIKPLNSWQIFLRDLNREDMHPSIENALTVMSSWSFVHKFHAKGEWTSGLRVLCKGIFVGAELLAVHDTIRLKPEGYHFNQHKVGETSKMTDVMVIDEITIVLTDCIDDPKDEQLATHYNALITGKMFTTNPDRGIHGGPFAEIDPTPLSTAEATETFRQAGMSEYGPWYRMANGKTCNVSPHHVIGRCYEPLAAQLMFSTYSFGYDLSSVMEGRHYSKKVDQRIPVGNTWFWGDSRVETLGLSEINGVECGRSASQRETPAKWQAVLQIAQGETSHAVRRRAGIPSSAGRPFGAKNGTSSRSNSGFAGVASTSKLVSSAIGSAPDDDYDDSEDTSGMVDDNVSVELDMLELEKAIKRGS